MGPTEQVLPCRDSQPGGGNSTFTLHPVSAVLKPGMAGILGAQSIGGFT